MTATAAAHGRGGAAKKGMTRQRPARLEMDNGRPRRDTYKKGKGARAESDGASVEDVVRIENVGDQKHDE